MYVSMLDTHIPMFNGCLTEMDVNKQDFLYWVRFYNNCVYSVPKKERPDEFTIDYDILLDEWLKKKEKSKESKNTPDRNSSGFTVDFG